METEEYRKYVTDREELEKESAGNLVRVSQRLKTRQSAKLNGKETFSERLKREFKEKRS